MSLPMAGLCHLQQSWQSRRARERLWCALARGISADMYVSSHWIWQFKCSWDFKCAHLHGQLRRQVGSVFVKETWGIWWLWLLLPMRQQSSQLTEERLLWWKVEEEEKRQSAWSQRCREVAMMSGLLGETWGDWATSRNRCRSESCRSCWTSRTGSWHFRYCNHLHT